jgi:hypothetical protein
LLGPYPARAVSGLGEVAHRGYYIDTLCFLAVTLLCLGYIEQGRALTNQALSRLAG